MVEPIREGYSQTDLDILMLFYTFSDQHGKVDIPRAAAWAQDKMGIIIHTTEFTLDQSHIDLLTSCQIIPDVTDILKKLRTG